MKVSSDHTAIRIQSRPPKGHEISFGTLLAKVGCQGAEKNCVRQTDRHNGNLYIDVAEKPAEEDKNTTYYNPIDNLPKLSKKCYLSDSKTLKNSKILLSTRITFEVPSHHKTKTNKQFNIK